MKYYMVGIKGAGMSALALILNDLGYEVSGYDDDTSHEFTEDKLTANNIKIYTGNESGIDSNSVVVRSSAIKDSHKEIQKAFELNLKVYEYNEMLGKLSTMFSSITVAGCHGKTTTTSMLAHVLNDIEGCNYLVGDGEGYVNKENKLFVFEACEYRRHFLEYSPYYAIITNIDLDHVDYYKDIDDVISAYQEYASKADKMVIACGDDRNTHTLEINKPIFYYGLNDDNDIIAKDIEYTNDGVNFDVFVEGNYYGHFELPFFGKHMILNALAVIGVCHYERIDPKEVAKSLKTFKGAKRRFAIEEIGDTVIIDDYAHHPEEVKVTIKAARQKYPDKKIVAVFQPHTFSRTKEFALELANSLNLADKAFVLDIYPAREKQEDYEGITSDIIINNLNNGEHINNDEVKKLLEYKNCVVMFMSPKEIYKLKEDFKNSISNEA